MIVTPERRLEQVLGDGGDGAEALVVAEPFEPASDAEAVIDAVDGVSSRAVPVGFVLTRQPQREQPVLRRRLAAIDKVEHQRELVAQAM